MNIIKRKLALKLTIFGVFLLFGCQNENYDHDLLESNKIVKDDLKDTNTREIYYQGFLINHRFETTQEDLEKEHTKKYLKEVYNKLRNNRNSKAHSRSASEEVALPGQNAILEASKVVLVDFPYEKIESFNLLLLREDNYFDIDMVTADFNNFTEQDIHSNNLVIDQ
tara:strand:+ start:142 stop:642 length:501 start_codon:yes stop_codon:yes gene_type:complete